MKSITYLVAAILALATLVAAGRRPTNFPRFPNELPPTGKLDAIVEDK